MGIDPVHLRSSYRQLLRTSLQAVRFAVPARYLLRSILRESFRESPERSYNWRRIQKTLVFLEHARDHKGLEHKIVKNILHMRWWKEKRGKTILPNTLRANTDVGIDLRQNVVSGAQFDATLTLFNESRDLCLRI